MCCNIFWIEESRSMIAFKHGQCPSRSKNLFKNSQGFPRTCEMLQDETDENVIERFGLVRQCEDICLFECNIRQAGSLSLALCLADRFRRDINCSAGSNRAPVGWD